MKSIKSHIQPQFFLKGFLAAREKDNHSDSLFIYKKNIPFKADGTQKDNNPAKSGLGKTGFIRNFYAFLKEDGTSDTKTYETRLEQEIENPGNKVLRKLRAIQLSKDEVLQIGESINNEERKIFARYVGGMFSRSKKSREQFNDAVLKIAEQYKTEVFSYQSIAREIPVDEKEKLDRYIDSVNPEFDKSIGGLSLPQSYLEKFNDKVQKDESFPKSIFWAIDVLEPIILKMKWQLRITPPPYKFFTGDVPVIWSDLREPNATLLFPISSNAIFCASNNQATPEIVFLEKHYEFVMRVRRAFAEECQELYFHTKAKWLVDFFNGI
jgi:hypothetical protein